MATAGMTESGTQQADHVSALSKEELDRLDAYWRALNYLSVGQIYLMDNPLLKEPLVRCDWTLAASV